MKEFWNMTQAAFTVLGGYLGYFLGGCDGLVYALLVFVVADYITGVMCAIYDKELSSEVGFVGICRKVMIFLLVGIANILDVNIIGSGCVLRTAVIFFDLSNEGVSLLENAAHLGLPVPDAMKDVLEQLHNRSETDAAEAVAEIAGAAEGTGAEDEDSEDSDAEENSADEASDDAESEG